MKLKEFGFRNITSYGNKLHTFTLSDDPELILIIGENGSGKTSISDVITFANYGKLRKRKISGFVNRKNKAGEAFSTFVTEDNRIVKTHRGIKPDFFNIEVDGIDKTVNDKNVIKNMLENELIGIPFDVFSNTLLLSINDFESFADMNAASKRKIVDRIFGIDIFNVMKKELNEKRREPQDEYILFDNEVNTKNSIIEQQKLKISELTVTSTQKKDSTLILLKSALADIENKVHIATSEHVLLENSTSSLKTEIDALNVTIRDQISTPSLELSMELISIDNKQESKLTSELNVLNSERIDLFTNLNNERIQKQTELLKPLNEKNTKLNKLSDEGFEKHTILENDKIAKINVKHDKIAKITAKETEVTLKEAEVTRTNFTKQLKESEKLKTDHYKLAIDLNNDLINIQKKIDLYKLGKCPECETDLTAGDHVHKNENYLIEYDKIEKKRSTAKSNFEKEKTRYNEIYTNSSTFEKTIIELQVKETQIRNNQLQKRNTELDENKQQLQELYLLEKETIKNEYTKIEEEIDKINNTLILEYEVKKEDIVSEYSDKEFNLKNKFQTETQKLKDSIEKQINDLKILNEQKTNERDTNICLYNEKLHEYNEKATSVKVLQSQFLNKKEEITKASTDDQAALILKGMRDNVEILEIDYNKSIENRDNADYTLGLYKAVDKLIGEDGLKRDFMQKFIPILNQNIHDVHTQLNFRYSFYFDDNFNPIVTDNNESIGLDTLSAGEKKEIDIMAALAFIPLIKMRNPYTNILFLDEIFYSLDKKNTALTVKLLKDFSIKYDMSIFVISHMDVPFEYFDKIYEPVFDGNFSDINQLK